MPIADELKPYLDGFLLESGVTFALLPVRCIDGRWAWLRLVGWADWNPSLFLDPRQTIRIYSLGSFA